MPLQAWLTLTLLVSMLALLAWDRVPIWTVFLGALTVAMTLQLAPTTDLLRGFSNSGVLTVAALFPVASGMYATGAISLLTQRILGSPRSEHAASRRILPAVAIGSAFINNTPMVAMFIPVVRDLRRQAGLVAPSLLMGITFASILGGNTTLIGGATNLIVAGMTADAIRAGELPGMQPIGMFELSLIGVPAAVAGLAYLIWVAPHLLRRVAPEASGPVPRPKYLCAFDVIPGSTLVARTVAEAHLATLPERRLVSVRRDGVELGPAPELTLRGSDRLTFAASAEAVSDLWTSIGLVPAHGTLPGDARHRHRLVEVVVAARAPAVGRRVADLPPPESAYRARVLGVSRHGDVPDRGLDELRVAPGDGAMLAARRRLRVPGLRARGRAADLDPGRGRPAARPAGVRVVIQRGARGFIATRGHAPPRSTRQSRAEPHSPRSLTLGRSLRARRVVSTRGCSASFSVRAVRPRTAGAGFANRFAMRRHRPGDGRRR
jgi:hypothetical protein